MHTHADMVRLFTPHTAKSFGAGCRSKRHGKGRVARESRPNHRQLIPSQFKCVGLDGDGSSTRLVGIENEQQLVHRHFSPGFWRWVLRFCLCFCLLLQRGRRESSCETRAINTRGQAAHTHHIPSTLDQYKRHGVHAKREVWHLYDRIGRGLFCNSNWALPRRRINQIQHGILQNNTDAHGNNRVSECVIHQNVTRTTNGQISVSCFECEHRLFVSNVNTGAISHVRTNHQSHKFALQLVAAHMFAQHASGEFRA